MNELVKAPAKNEEAIKRKIVELGPWFHQIEITPNLRTRDVAASPGPQAKDHPASRWAVLKDMLPADMSGMRVLDIGCADGFFAIEMAKRGAHVVAVDAARQMYNRLDWAVKQLGLKKQIKTRCGTIEDLDSKERYDAIVFIALLYHLKSPIVGLEKLAPMSDRIYLETTVTDGEEPYMYFKPPMPGVHDEPKWFPTTSCVKAMMESVGYDVEVVPYPIPNRAMFNGKR